MIEFSIGRKDYTIDKIKVKHYYQIQDLQFLDGVDSQLRFISAISECPETELKKLTKSEFTELWIAVYETYLTQKRDQPLQKIITLNDTVYGIVHLDELTVGEFADLDVIQNDPLREKKLHQMMSILYRPLKGQWKNGKYYQVEPYDSKKCNERSEDFLELELDVVMGATNFFLAIANYSLNRMLDSLETQMETKEEKLILEDLRWTINQLLEDGLSSSSSSQEKILSNLTVLQKSILERLSTMQPTSKTKTSSLSSKLKEKLASFVTRSVATKSNVRIKNPLAHGNHHSKS
jgi:hypothetical protein